MDFVPRSWAQFSTTDTEEMRWFIMQPEVVKLGVVQKI